MAPIRLAPTFVLAPSKSANLLTADFDPGLSGIKAFTLKFLIDFSFVLEGSIFLIAPVKIYSKDKSNATVRYINDLETKRRLSKIA